MRRIKNLLSRLVRIRELRLEQESYQLKSQVSAESHLRSSAKAEEVSARNILDEGKNLPDLALLGEARLRTASNLRTLKLEIEGQRSEVLGAYRKYIAVKRLKHSLAQKEKQVQEERGEKDNEQFVGWQRLNNREIS